MALGHTFHPICLTLSRGQAPVGWDSGGLHSAWSCSDQPVVPMRRPFVQRPFTSETLLSRFLFLHIWPDLGHTPPDPGSYQQDGHPTLAEPGLTPEVSCQGVRSPKQSQDQETRGWVVVGHSLCSGVVACSCCGTSGFWTCWPEVR